MKVMNQDTLVPLSVLAFIMGGVFWISSVYSQTVQNTQSIQEIQHTLARWSDSKELIVDRLARIEQKLDTLHATEYDNPKNNQKRIK